MAGNTEVGSAYVSVRTKLDRTSVSKTETELEGSLGGTGTRLGGKLGGGMSKGLAAAAGVIGGIVGSIANSAMDAIVSSMGDAIHRLDTIQNFPKIMANLGYNTDDAAAAVARISESLKGLPTSTDAMISSVQKMAPMTSTLDEAVSVSLALNNALLAGGKSTEYQSNALEQYSQMLAAGKVDMQGWRSMLDAMPGQLDQLAKSLLGAGANQMDLYNAMQDGTVTFEDFNSALLALNEDGIDGLASFEEQARSATGGVETSMENVKNAITRNLANIMQTIGQENIAGMFANIAASIDSIGGAITGAIKGFQEFSDRFSPMFDVIGQNMNEANDSMTESMGVLGKAIEPTVQQFAAFASGEGPQFQFMMDNASAAAEACGPAFEGLGDAFDYLTRTLEPIINVLGPALLWVISAIGSALQWLIPGIVYVVGIVIEVVATIIDLVTHLVMFIADIVMSIVTFFTVDVPAGINVLISFFSSIPGAIAGFFGQIPGIVQGVFDNVINTVMSIPDRIVGFFAGIGGRISAAFGSIHFPQPHIGWSSVDIMGTSISIPSIQFYARGGYLPNMSLIGVSEEVGEGIVPLEGRHMYPLADAMAERLGSGRTVNVYIDGNLMRISRIAQDTFDSFMDEISRYGVMQGVSV